MTQKQVGNLLITGVGAGFAGILDAMKNGTTELTQYSAVTVHRIQFALTDIWATLHPLAFAYLLLVLAGILVCWVYKPSTTKEAFIIGLSVFSMFSVGSPYEKAQQNALSQAALSKEIVTQPSTAFLSALVKVAHADEPATQQKIGTYFFTFRRESYDHGSSIQLLVSIYSDGNRVLIGRQNINSNQPMRIQLPYGHYVAEVEGSGLERSMMKFDVSMVLDGNEFALGDSDWPLYVQRFHEPSEIQGRDLDSVEVEKLENDYRAKSPR